MIVYANPSSNTTLPTVRENMKYRELPAAENTTAVPFVPNVPSLLKIVPMAVPDTTPVTGVLPVRLTPTVTFPTNPAPMAVRLTTVARSVPPAKTTPIAVRRRFPVTTDVPRLTPAVSAPLVRAILIVTCPTSPAPMVVLLTTAVQSAPSASLNPYAIPALQTGVPFTPLATVTAVLTEQFNPATPDAAVPVATPTLATAFPAALTLTAPVALVTATPGITSRVLPVLKTRYILTATLAHQGTAAQTLGEVRLRRRPRPVLVVLLREPVTKPRRTLTATAVPAGTSLPAVRPLRPRPGQLPRFALVVRLPAPVISVRLAPIQVSVPAIALQVVRMEY